MECSGFSNKPSRTVGQHTCQYSSHQYFCQWRCPLSLWHALNKTVGNSYAEKSKVSDPLGISFHGVQWYLISPRHCLIRRIRSSSESARTGTENQKREGLYKIEVFFFPLIHAVDSFLQKHRTACTIDYIKTFSTRENCLEQQTFHCGMNYNNFVNIGIELIENNA